jgi:2,3-bisphosphoglycerate-dependent phosphoglycerate mutase
MDKNKSIHKLVLIKDGEGFWGADNKIKGWIDLELSKNGIIEAKNAAAKLKNFKFDIVHTSYLRRAVKTWNIIAEEINQHHIPVKKTWRLNERHFGILQGLGEKDIIKRFGDDQFFQWKKVYNKSPPEIEISEHRVLRQDEKYKNIPAELIPYSEVKFLLIPSR